MSLIVSASQRGDAPQIKGDSIIAAGNGPDSPISAKGAGQEQPPEEKFFMDWPAWLGRLVGLWFKTVRVKNVNRPDVAAQSPMILAFWHRDDICLIGTQPDLNGNIMISQSRDGAILSRAVGALGFHTTRGSSSRGGAGALIALKRSMEQGVNPSFAADGPRGPRQVAKPGPIYLAAKTGRPIYPIGVAVDRFYCLEKAWNKPRLPLPGARVVAAFGPPLYIPKEGVKWPACRQSRILGAAICQAGVLAEKELGIWLKG